jgi:hypothetical protein
MLHTIGEQGSGGRMTNEELIERISAVNPVWAETMRENTTAFEWRPIPFYRKFQLLVATVQLARGVAEFRYADDGSSLHILRATPEHIYEVNQSEGLQLDDGQVPSYVRFFFDNLGGRRTAVVERPEEVPWFEPSSADPDLNAQKEHASSLIHSMLVMPSDADDYDVAATGVTGTQLKEIDLAVKRDGKIDVRNERVLIEDIPVVEEFF